MRSVSVVATRFSSAMQVLRQHLAVTRHKDTPIGALALLHCCDDIDSFCFCDARLRADSSEGTDRTTDQPCLFSAPLVARSVAGVVVVEVVVVLGLAARRRETVGAAAEARVGGVHAVQGVAMQILCQQTHQSRDQATSPMSTRPNGGRSGF